MADTDQDQSRHHGVRQPCRRPGRIGAASHGGEQDDRRCKRPEADQIAKDIDQRPPAQRTG